MLVKRAEEKQPEAQEFSPEELSLVDAIVEEHRAKPGSLIPVLEEIQETIGYLPKMIQRRIALGLNIPFSEVYGVVTFYSFFTMVPKGRHPIKCCLGTACYVRGGKKVLDKLIQTLKIDPGETTPDRRFSLETVRCLGACGLAPTMVIDDDSFPQVTPSSAGEILENYP
jgi:NADH-quinone oxidoreductase subunit E/NADP-reducing hydrogenase subunit HndA